MYEEEKMARDVYAYFSTLYTLPVFRNITKSEQVHMNAVKNLITGFKVEDGEIFEKGAGEFYNPEISALYTELTGKGKVSLRAASVNVMKTSNRGSQQSSPPVEGGEQR